MPKSLVIVESPAKVKSINKFLGRDFIVKSSIGHIRDLAKSGTIAPRAKKKTADKTASKPDSNDKQKKEHAKLVGRMGIDPENNWEAHYEILPGKDKVLKQLQEAAEKVDTIYLATDLDREGEAIAWHLQESIGGDKEKYKRVTFTEITKRAVLAAFESPGQLNMDRVNAQQARRFLDRVVGYMVSPLLWAKVARGLSAGRVQSVAVRLLSEREREIHAFKTDEYWEINALLATAKGGKETFSAQVTKHQGQAFRPTDETAAKKAKSELESNPCIVSKVEKKPTRSKPSAPFITSTLQQAASVRLGFGVKKTMILAQQLYEAGHITYMRTDSTNLSKDAVEACREYISSKFGKKYLPDQPCEYVSKKSAQEAHEAIRPTDLAISADAIGQILDKDAARLYDMIWRQFVSCQMTVAEFDSTSVVMTCGPYELRARGRVMRFDGYQKVQPPIASKKADEDATHLPEMQEKETLTKRSIDPSQHFTKPPPRFSEASLVRELEKQGIGRPSTYASIISTIQERGYARVQNRRFFCLKMGDIVTDRLCENFTDLLDYRFTAQMEEELDKIASGEMNWRNLLNSFYKKFVENLGAASKNMRPNIPTMTQIPCPECQKPMAIRTARTGVFLSCSGYNLPPKERCLGTINLVPGEEVEAYSSEGDDDEVDVREIQNKRRCQICDTAMDAYLVNEHTRLFVCGNNPECEGLELEEGNFRIKGYEGPVIQCDKCGSDMQLKTGRFGKYFGCTAKDCKNTRKLLRNGEAAPPRAEPIHMTELVCSNGTGHFVLRDGAAGLFLASSEFPRSRETKKPQVDDLIRHKDKLDPKYQFLTLAPARDPEGNPAIIRFSRKAKVHFISSESSGWNLHFRDGKWVEGVPE